MLAGGGSLTAEIDVPDGGGAGVLAAIGDLTNGLALYVTEGRLAAALSIGNDLARVVAPAPLAPGRRVVGVVLRDEGAGCRIDLVDDGEVVGSGTGEHAVPFVWQHGGAALTIGHDTGLAVCDDYVPPATWTGVLHEVVMEAGVDDQLSAAAARAAMSAE
jgi:arylsulfatase